MVNVSDVWIRTTKVKEKKKTTNNWYKNLLSHWDLVISEKLSAILLRYVALNNMDCGAEMIKIKEIQFLNNLYI